MQKRVVCFSRQMPRPGGGRCAFPPNQQSGAFLRDREIACSWIWLRVFCRDAPERELPPAFGPACGSARRTRRPHGAPVLTARSNEDSRDEHAHVRIFHDTATCRSNVFGESGPTCAASHVFRTQTAIGRVLPLSRAFCFVRNPTANPLFGACCLSWSLSCIHQENAWPKMPTPFDNFCSKEKNRSERPESAAATTRSRREVLVVPSWPAPTLRWPCLQYTNLFIACRLLCPQRLGPRGPSGDVL